MAEPFSMEAFRERWLNPPRHLFALRPHVAQAPAAVQSRLVPAITADTFHSAASLLRRARESPAQASNLRTQALEILKQDLSGDPRLQPYLGLITYDPSQFTGPARGYTAFTQGWSDSSTPEGRPRAFLNHDAFKSVMFLNTVVHHEGGGHLPQRFNPAVFKPPSFDAQTVAPYWHLAEVHAHLNDLQHRTSLGMTPLMKSYGLERAEESWWGLSDQHRYFLRNQYNTTRQTVLQELQNTPFRSPPSYSQFDSSHSFQLRNFAGGFGVSPTTFPSALGQYGRGLYR